MTKGSAPARPGLRLREEIQPGVPRFTGFTHGQEPVGEVWPGDNRAFFGPAEKGNAVGAA